METAAACTAGSLVGGPGWDKKEIEMMEKGMARFASATLKGGQLVQRVGIPATTTAAEGSPSASPMTTMAAPASAATA